MIKETVIDAVFKSYDIRGIADEQLDEEFAQGIGNAYGQHYKVKQILVGRDGRESSPKLAKALIKGLREAGVDVIDAGLVSTPMIKWVIAEHGLDGGIMVSASHNPPQYNGFKVFEKKGVPVGQAHGLHTLKDYLNKPISERPGRLEERSYQGQYVAFLRTLCAGSKTPVFVDPSGGVAGPIITELVKDASYSWTLFNEDLDPGFSVHDPNPLNPEAQAPAKEHCKEHACMGAILDADADRLIMIDEAGEQVDSSYLGALLVELLLAEGEGVTATVRDSRAVRDATLAKDGHYITSPVGHANIHRAMVEHGLHVGVEKSGHLYFSEAHHSDGGLFALLLLLKHLKGTLRESIEPFKKSYHSSPEINFAVTDKEAVLKAAKEHYAKQGRIDELDGVLCEGNGWWVSIRASNTEPVVRLTFESTDEKSYQALEADARKLLEPFGQQG